MNKDKQYYLDLAERWFDAETSEAEEKELRRFLAATEDPDFDEARAALGFLAASSLRAEAPKSPIDLPRQIDRAFGCLCPEAGGSIAIEAGGNFRADEDGVDIETGLDAVLELTTAFDHKKALLLSRLGLFLEKEQIPDLRVLGRCNGLEMDNRCPGQTGE